MYDQLILKRHNQSEKATLGFLMFNGRQLCYTLEDPYQSEKIYGQTRIPAGEYELTNREYGGFHKRYSDKFPGMHRGMLQLANVPNFTDILIHIGNTHENTHGCILLGTGCDKDINGDHYVTSSTAAYEKVYPFIHSALDLRVIKGITILDEGDHWSA